MVHIYVCFFFFFFFLGGGGGGGGGGGTYELLNIRACEYQHLNKTHIFQYMGKMFCVGF